MVTRKTALTFEEKITAAHLYYVQGIDQHVIAFAMNVNMGRVNEACVKVGDALGGRGTMRDVTSMIDAVRHSDG